MYYDQILRVFLCIPSSAVDAAAVNPNGTKTLVANGLITLFISSNPVHSNRPKGPPDSIILGNCVFDNLISVDVYLAKALQRFAIVYYLIIVHEEVY